jgi:hypothetical protein
MLPRVGPIKSVAIVISQDMSNMPTPRFDTPNVDTLAGAIIGVAMFFDAQ